MFVHNVMMEIIFRIPLPEGFDLGKTVKIERAQPYNETGGRALMRVEEKSESKVKEALSSQNVLRIDFSDKGEGGMASVVLNKCEICRLLEDSFLIEARKENDKNMLWKVLVPDPSSFSPEKLRDINAEVVSIKQVAEKATLTEKEDEALRVAFEMGYFEVPRMAGIRDIALRLGRSPSTVDETLRRAEKKILEKCLESK